MRKLMCACLILFVFIAAGCSSTSTEGNSLQTYSLGTNAKGCLEYVNNVQNVSIVSKDDSVYRAEYKAGFIQGKLQGSTILSSRDNTWDFMYIVDPSHSYPKQIPPSAEELARARQVLLENYTYTIEYIQSHPDPIVRQRLKRILFRMLGLYHGARLKNPANLDFGGEWVPGPSYFKPEELVLGYETGTLTWMDVLFLNLNADFGDVISFSPEGTGQPQMSRCSAFVKKDGDDIFIAHNSWYGFLSQTMTINYYVNNDYLAINTIMPGMISSDTDFGFNNKGMMFCETTHRVSHTEPRVESLWTYWRSSTAEQFSGSLEEFFEMLTLDNSGTYQNGYILADAKTNEIGLIETSYKCFVFYRPSGNTYEVTTKPEGFSTEYDEELVQPGYILGINFPASLQVRNDLQSTDNRPARRRQFLERIGGVTDLESARSLITYTDPENPLSIYGRWDLGYGETPYPKTVPDGSVDAKAANRAMVFDAMDLAGVFDEDSPATGFWMRYGTPHVNGKPFIWSESQWKDQKLRDVPDRVDGSFHLMKVHMR